MINALRRWAGQPVGHGRALSTFFVNQFATPGLGSLVAGRRMAGVGQLLLSCTGFALLMIWFVRVMIVYYSLMSFSAPNQPPDLHHELWKIGAALFGVAWVWALFTSLSVLREARANALRTLSQESTKPPRIEDCPPTG